MFEGTRPWNADEPHGAAPIFSFCYFSSFPNLASSLKINGPDFPFRASHFWSCRHEVACAIATGNVCELRRMSLT